MKFKSTTSGFTLVEMIVSIGIFIVVALISVGAFLKIMDANKKAQSLKTAINNINFALESMTRELRVGSNYYCYTDGDGIYELPGNTTLPPSQSCDPLSNPLDPWTIAFYSTHTYAPTNGAPICNLIFAYAFHEGTLKKYEQKKCSDSVAMTLYAPLVSPDIVFSQAIISVETTDGGTIVRQPYIFLRLEGYSGQKVKTQTAFDIQTSISQRLIE